DREATAHRFHHIYFSFFGPPISRDIGVMCSRCSGCKVLSFGKAKLERGEPKPSERGVRSRVDSRMICDARNFIGVLSLGTKSKRKEQSGKCKTENTSIYHSRLVSSICCGCMGIVTTKQDGTDRSRLDPKRSSVSMGR